MSDYLPKDVLTDILRRLPPKTLVQCTLVCKSWYFLITNPSFISIHLNTSIENDPNQLVLVRHYDMFKKIGRYALHVNNRSFDEFVELNCPCYSANEYFRIVGCCNGLICLSDDYDSYIDTVILWNPSIKKSLTLPKPQIEYTTHGLCQLGFGFDSMKNDYKVVRIVYLSNQPDDYNYRLPPGVEVYTLSMGTWRSISDSAPSHVIHNNSPSPVFVKGAVHWVASSNDEKNASCINLIEAFDMGAEIFREIAVPQSVVDIHVIKLSVMVLDDSLALVEYERIWQSDNCWIWVMKDYGVGDSWRRLYSIDMRGGIRTVLGLGKNNEVFLSARRLGMVSYDPKSKKMKSVGIRGTNRSFYVGRFVESLVLLKRVDSLTNEEAPLLPNEEGAVDEQQ